MSNTPAENKTIELAIGRILRMGSRPTQPGDIQEYERCRKIIMDTLRPSGCAQQVAAAPLPGWNFGIGAAGCIE